MRNAGGETWSKIKWRLSPARRAGSVIEIAKTFAKNGARVVLADMNLSHLHSMKSWEFLTISTKEASARKKVVFFHSMNASEAFWMGPVSNIDFAPMGRSNPSTTSCLRNP
jgi:hypothetical protein